MTLSVSLSHRFEGFSLEVSFTAAGGVTALFGRSGSGKTSVVNAVAGLLRPRSGRIVVGDTVLFDRALGLDVPVHRRRIGYVFQDSRLFPHLSVQGNLDYAPRRLGLPPDRAGFERVVEMLGIGSLLDRRPGALSGGERQRVALGRALLAKPDLLLMDEPLAALDDARKAEILPFLERLRDERGTPILYVSHSLPEIARLATTVVVLEAGRVTRSGPTAEILSDPDAAPALGVREAGAILEGRVARHHADGLTEFVFSGGTLLLPRADVPIGGVLRVRISASDVLLARTPPREVSALNVLPVTVDAVRRGRHGGAIVRLRCGSDLVLSRISARAADRMALLPGTALFAVIEPVSVAQRDIGLGGL